MNMNEAFEQAFASRKAAYQDNQFEVLFSKLQEQHNELEYSMTILDEAVKLQANLELLQETPGNAPLGGQTLHSDDAKPRDPESSKKDDAESDKKYNDIKKEVSAGIDNIMKLLSKNQSSGESARDNDSLAYKPVAGFAIDKGLGDLSFPQNIIHFVKTIIEWIKNLILFAIKGIRNIIKGLFGGATPEEKEEVYDLKKKLKLSFKKTQLFKVMGTPIVVDKNRATGTQRNVIISAREMDGSEVKKLDLLGESALNEFTLTIGKGSSQKSDQSFKTTSQTGESKGVVISLDVTKDVVSLKEYCRHFFDLFDNAFGSNNEFLFGTDDVEMLLKAFETMRKNLESGRVSAFSIGSTRTSNSLIDADKMRAVAVNTNINTKKLTEAYTQTFNKITDILRTVQAKTFMQSMDYGISAKLLAHNTVGALLDITDAIEPRIKNATKVDAELHKIQNLYEDLVAKLQKHTSVLGSYGDITLVSTYQRDMRNLFDAARYTSQVISMRVSALGLYLKQLKDLKNMLDILAKFDS